MIHTPTAAVTHCSQFQRRYMPSSAKTATSSPDTISLTPRRILRMLASSISCPSAGGGGTLTGSSSPRIIGDEISHRPSMARQWCPERPLPVLLQACVHLRLVALQRSCYPPPCLRELRPRCRHRGRMQLVLLVPVGRVCLKPAYHLQQRSPETVTRSPAEQPPSARGINLVMVVGVLDHPRLDVGVLVQHLGPSVCGGGRDHREGVSRAAAAC